MDRKPRPPNARTGQAEWPLSREAFDQRYRHRFYDPAFADAERSIQALLDIAWDGYMQSRKSPVVHKAGKGFADPEYEISAEWLRTRAAIHAAQRRHDDPSGRSRVLLICGAARNDKTCPGEMSKTFRLVQMAKAALEAADTEVDLLDLSVLTSEYGKVIYPCKACVSTAMPLCHWPCSCYPNHSLGQVNDWMGELYPRWVAAHGIMIVTPVYWYQALELEGWSYPRHLAGRSYSVVVHGDTAGTENLRRSLSDWLNDMDLVQAGAASSFDRYIDYFGPYATSHEALDKDEALHEETRNAARALAVHIRQRRDGLALPDEGLKDPRPK
jgi:multimeric flavodoxin WrbA